MPDRSVAKLPAGAARKTAVYRAIYKNDPLCDVRYSTIGQKGATISDILPFLRYFHLIYLANQTHGTVLSRQGEAEFYAVGGVFYAVCAPV